MNNISQAVSVTNKSPIFVMFDVGSPGTAELLCRLHVSLRGYGTVEVLDQNHYVLAIWPGAAREVA